MVCPSSFLAHLAQLIVTIGCMKSLGNSYYAKDYNWPLHAFQLLLVHSIVGILRFGTELSASSSIRAKYFRNFYNWSTRIIDVIPLACFTTGILNSYGVNRKVRLVIFTLGIVPIFFQLNTKRKGSQIRKHRLLTNFIAAIQLFMVILVGLRNNNYYVISFVVSYAFELFFIDEFCYYYDIPNTDLTQYSLCFTEVYAVLVLNEL